MGYIICAKMTHTHECEYHVDVMERSRGYHGIIRCDLARGQRLKFETPKEGFVGYSYFARNVHKKNVHTTAKQNEKGKIQRFEGRDTFEEIHITINSTDQSYVFDKQKKCLFLRGLGWL